LKILIVSATAKENSFTSGLDLKKGFPVRIKEPLNHDVDVLVTGVGAVQTAFSLTRFAGRYQLIINIGIAGSYKSEFPLGTVVGVKEDAFGDYGIDDRGTFKSFATVNLIAKDEFPFQGDTILNPWLRDEFFNVKLPMVKGVTLSTASGSAERINKIKKDWDADIETMESASVFYVCRMLGVRFFCFRAISNMVEPRDKAKWKLEGAVRNLNAEVRNFIKNLNEDKRNQ
jgi:futalosine hydrolase